MSELELDVAVSPGFVAVYDQVHEHALQEHPREACGLLVRGENDVIVYRRCRNAAPESAQRDAFKIHPHDWVAAEDSGEVIAVVHSHPDSDAHPTDADRAMCHRSGLAWFVIAVPGGAWSSCRPQPLPLVGRTFFHGTVDCYTLIQDYFAQELSIALPHFERPDDWWQAGPNGEPGADLYRRHFQEAGFVELGRPAGRPDGTVQLRRHDCLLMQVRSDQENHAAVFVGPHNGVDCILHHLYGGLSGHHPWGGYWLRNSTAVLRHRSLL